MNRKKILTRKINRMLKELGFKLFDLSEYDIPRLVSLSKKLELNIEYQKETYQPYGA